MEPPQVQYVRTQDGVSIAYWTLGQGVPLLLASPLVYSHIGLERQFPPLRDWYERLAERAMVIRYDPRGYGLSERDVSDMSADALMSDTDAVLDRLGWIRLPCLRTSTTGCSP